jgi:hypothetical protein
MPVLPARFLFRMAYRCRYVPAIPQKGDDLLDLPQECRISNWAAMEGLKTFAEVRLAWNELGIGLQVEVRGKEQEVTGHPSKLKASDGVTLWIDTRDSRSAHRASRYCHQFHLLPTGGGNDGTEAYFAQAKIHRALQDAPHCPSHVVVFRATLNRGGYLLEAFLPATAMHGFDPEQSRRLGIYYVVRDNELGDQTLSVSSDFPYWEDPSLWSVLELAR